MQVPVSIGVTAQVCGISAAVIAKQRNEGNDVACTLTQEQATAAGLEERGGQGGKKK